jgi:hypothetical protein
MRVDVCGISLARGVHFSEGEAAITLGAVLQTGDLIRLTYQIAEE